MNTNYLIDPAVGSGRHSTLACKFELNVSSIRIRLIRGIIMQQYNKLGAAGLAGALVTIFIPIVSHFFPFLGDYMTQPTSVAAVQTIFTALVVHLAPDNR
jgi:hypothetical protein